METIVRHILSSGARRVLDLGCGEGELLLRLAGQEPLELLMGLDIDAACVDTARQALEGRTAQIGPYVEVRQGSFTEPDTSLQGFDIATLIETIEHIDPRHLSRLEDAVFRSMRPGKVLVTTPNQEYNALYGLAPGEMRHPGHFFEWTRARFRKWGWGVASRHGYRVRFLDLGPLDPAHGGSTQMARFTLEGGRI
ncbi:MULTISPECIES: methyltransferase domain-containing protein [unclassified Ectothiorhodospira]|uniref:methyltransferase domain-containing protein n=1 Tax=unclassified Ectothiorhodospira TaxID=2684909 RepID=UPI001EE98070|nr:MULTISPECIES: methyltransferase domain-containing protein [unclassified Ectothiorhodospira]MCG5516914.1 class I SAM-dependent methyltransferase [Ectothiorhodospira sp. 9100]MCG5519895.1 class I SAM-dependent methyltransferase [Ectothiorhodospira sp. 9905]